MAVAFDTSAESHTGTTGSTSEASFDISITPSASVKGIVVYVVNASSTTDTATSVKINPAGVNTDVPAVSGGRAVDTATEPGSCKAFFLGAGLPAGGSAWTVRVNRTNNTDVMYAVVQTFTASVNTAVHTAGIVLLQDDGTLAEQSVTDGSTGVNSVRTAGLYSGLQSLATAGASSTLDQSIDFGANGAVVVHETTAGQGSRSVGFSSGTSDDRAAPDGWTGAGN